MSLRYGSPVCDAKGNRRSIDAATIVGWGADQSGYFFTQLLFLHRWLLLQSLFFSHATHLLLLQISLPLQSLSFLHSTHLPFLQTSSPLQSLSLSHDLANALSVSAESPARPSAPPATALSMPRRDSDPKAREMASN